MKHLMRHYVSPGEKWRRSNFVYSEEGRKIDKMKVKTENFHFIESKKEDVC